MPIRPLSRIEGTTMDIAAATKLSDALRPKTEGEVENVHVVRLKKEPSPDFEAMRKLVSGEDANHKSGERERDDEKRTVPANE